MVTKQSLLLVLILAIFVSATTATSYHYEYEYEVFCQNMTDNFWMSYIIPISRMFVSVPTLSKAQGTITGENFDVPALL